MKIDITKIVFWTTNEHKIKEVSNILWFELNWYTKEDKELIDNLTNWKWIPEIQSMDLEEVVKTKAKEAFKILNKPVLVEDTWYFLEALKWFPWPLVKYIVDEEWPWINLLFKMMENEENRTIYAKTWFAVYDWTNYYTWFWELKWNIPLSPRWNKFGWSNAFEIPELNKTFWEITDEEKNQISMRKIALENFLENIK